MKERHRYGIEGIFASILFVALIVVVLLQVAGRTGLFPSIVWTEELARWLWVWVALIGVAEVERTNTHLRMNFLTDFLGKRFQSVLYFLFDLVWLIAMCQLIWIAYKTVMRTTRNQSVTLIFNDWVLYLSFLVASLFIVFRVGQRMILTLQGKSQSVRINQ